MTSTSSLINQVEVTSVLRFRNTRLTRTLRKKLIEMIKRRELKLYRFFLYPFNNRTEEEMEKFNIGLISGLHFNDRKKTNKLTTFIDKPEWDKRYYWYMFEIIELTIVKDGEVSNRYAVRFTG